MTLTSNATVQDGTRLERQVSEALSTLAEAASVRRGVPQALLDGYLEALLAVARTGRALSAEQQASCRRLGGEAVTLGVGLPALVDAHMNASRRLWSRMPELLGAVRNRPVRSAELMGIGEAVWRAADAALAALTSGFVDAQRLVVRREEELRREFVDDLLCGRSSVGPLIERAEAFGLHLNGGHVVVVAAADRPVDAASGIRGLAEDALRSRFGDRGALATVKDGRLVSILSGAQGPGDPADLGRQLADLIGPLVSRAVRGDPWRAGVGRTHKGPRGVQRSYQEALEALETAARLRLPQQVAPAADLLVYRVLARDETALADLVHAVLDPLTAARGGAAPLLDTLEAYFSAGRNAAEAARRLHLSVRAVTYRLQRVQELTGYAAGNPAHHLPLLVAVTGARLLDWPREPLVNE